MFSHFFLNKENIEKFGYNIDGSVKIPLAQLLDEIKKEQDALANKHISLIDEAKEVANTQGVLYTEHNKMAIRLTKHKDKITEFFNEIGLSCARSESLSRQKSDAYRTYKAKDFEPIGKTWEKKAVELLLFYIKNYANERETNSVIVEYSLLALKNEDIHTKIVEIGKERALLEQKHSEIMEQVHELEEKHEALEIKASELNKVVEKPVKLALECNLF